MINLLCLLHLFGLFRCFFGTGILELLHVVEWKCVYWTERSCAYPWPGDHDWGDRGQVPPILRRDACCTRLICWSLIRLGQSFMGQHCLHLGTSETLLVHLQKTAMSPSAWGQLGFEEVCWTHTAWFSLLGGEGGCWASDAGIGLCWRPACCPGTTPVEFCQLLWHRTRVPWSVVVKGWWGRQCLQCVLWWPVALVRWWEREGMGCWTRWCSYKLCAVKHLASKYLLKCVSTWTAIKNLCWWLISVLNYCFIQMNMH